ncbi:MAG: LacI family DNA-binding transcriptional regulator [Anaerolineae bacterium]|nr:LacI family DNA-binding transcriptional regulator [Anaerolineae bacterium]
MVKKLKLKSRVPTMHDVAALAGVSQPTVSRVLNHNETTVQISEETRQRVLNAVEQLGYRPNVVARSLRTQRTQTVALLIADISNGFYHPIARAVQDIARQHDYEVLISNSDHIYENEKHFCEIVLSRGIDGVMMVPVHLTTEDLDHYVSQTNIPFVVLGEYVDHPDIDVIYVRDEQATYEATQWLIAEHGHRTIGFIGVPDGLPPGPRRWRGFNRAMQEAGLSIDPRFVQQGDFTLESGTRAAHALLEHGELPSALIVGNDLMAIGAILTLQDAGYTIPDDVAIVGFDDIPEATIVRPRLTTIAQDPRDIGQKMATALFERLANPTLGARRLFESPYKLIVRETT